MRLDRLLEGMDATLPVGGEGVEIWTVADDSRTVRPGALFVARGGSARDGRDFLADAKARGAVAALVSRDASAGAFGDGAVVRCDDPAALVAAIADRFHGNACATLPTVGVTGTNGKTTIAYLVHQLLAAGGKRAGLIGTVEIDDGLRRVPSSLTTPGAVELSELFARMLDHGCAAVAMEASSHALDQGRVDRVRFEVGIFTNLTGDHLDYHGTMERYAEAKARLFARLPASGTAILNRDDPWWTAMAKGPAMRLTCTAKGDPGAECAVSIEEVRLEAMRCRFRGPWGEFTIDLPLVGRHNAMNALEAAAAAWCLGVDEASLRSGLERCSAPPGRLQPVRAERDGGGFSVLVDYAHTDDALLNVLTALRPVVPEGGALRVVFGCGGDRDRTKRPRMAKVACDHADEVVVTSDNPRTEDPQAIIADILAGVPEDSRGKVRVEPDRSAAIALAVRAARRGDVVLIAGKGHEDYQIVGTEKRRFDDRAEAEGALRNRIAEVKP
jgi:UDP-N-acetylmuramoyl-L-alanyl-D-glutamate--2,6-diaminopimelate ligase